MVGLVITPSNSTLYVGTNMFGTNTIVRSATQTIVNSNAPFGAGIEIGTDPATLPNFSFGGYISSVAMFNNSLSALRWKTSLTPASPTGWWGRPLLSPTPRYELQLLAGSSGSSGGALTVTASGFGTQPCGGYWQVWNPGTASWVLATNPYGFSGGTNAPLVNTLQVGTLTITNFQAFNAGSYRLVITNAAGLTPASGAAISTVVSVSAYTSPAGSYAAVAGSAGYGAVALWPLNETVDPSPGGAVAYDIIGGFNGTYGTNANNGGGNASNSFSPALPAGPAAGLTGLPSGGALGPNPSMGRTYVGTTNSPLFPGLTSAGRRPYQLHQHDDCRVDSIPTFTLRTNSLGSCASAAGLLGPPEAPLSATMATRSLVTWATPGTTPPALPPASIPASSPPWACGPWLHWSFQRATPCFILAMPARACRSAVQNVVWPNEPWGKGVSIGDDPGGAATGRAISGAISSVTMFSNSLSAAQIVNLFTAGEGTNVVATPPMIIVNPQSLQLIAGVYASITGTGNGGQNCNGYWQQFDGSAWTNLANGGGISGATNTVSSGLNQVGVLVITNVQAANQGSYRLVFTNSVNPPAVSSTATITVIPSPATNTFAGVALGAGYGAVAYWPLNETVDPSTGLAEAYEVIGGFNGTYATNADNGGGNALNGFTPIAGPAAAGLLGFSAGGAFASVQNMSNTFVSALASPTFPGLNGPAGVAVPNSTNVTIAAWVKPNVYPESGNAPVLLIRSGYLGGTRTDGLRIWGNSLGRGGK